MPRLCDYCNLPASPSNGMTYRANVKLWLCAKCDPDCTIFTFKSNADALRESLEARAIRLRAAWDDKNSTFDHGALVRCFSCDPVRGKENYAMAVTSGTCAWCGATRIESDIHQAFIELFGNDYLWEVDKNG